MKRLLLISILCGVIAALSTAAYLLSLDKKYRQGLERVPVLVATQYIDQGTMIDTGLVEVRTIPKEFLQPKALQTAAELLQDGRRQYMALAPVEKGEQITTTKLSLLGEGTGIAGTIPTEKRAVTLLFDRDVVSGILKPGNRIDIIGIFDYENKDHRSQEGAFTVLQNILVLAAGKSLLGVVREKDTSSETMRMEQEKIPVSLSVTPEEAEILLLASERGTIKPSLRPLGDDTITAVQGIRIQDIAREMTVTTKNTTLAQSAPAPQVTPEQQRKQKEILEIISKYKK